jgi:hypothetical protein
LPSIWAFIILPYLLPAEFYYKYDRLPILHSKDNKIDIHIYKSYDYIPNFFIWIFCNPDIVWNCWNIFRSLHHMSLYVLPSYITYNIFFGICYIMEDFLINLQLLHYNFSLGIILYLDYWSLISIFSVL